MAMLPHLLILLEIISRLPAKAITQCKTVCKEWLAMLSTQHFLSIHCRYMRTCVDQKILFATRRACLLRSLNPVSVDFITPTNVHIPFDAEPDNLLFLASLDGMLCVCLKNTCEMVVWNPLTRVYKKLSNSNSQGFYKVQSDALGFFVDSSFDHNIIHIKRRRGTMTIFIYSMALSEWRTCRFLKKRPYHNNTYNWSKGTLCGTGLYFTVSQFWLAGNVVILRFDVNSKVFSEICYPNALDQGARGILVNIRDELCMFVYNGFYARKLEFWKMKDDMWTRVFIIPRLVCIPIALSCTITHLNVDDTCLAITEWGEVFTLGVTSNGIWSCLPLTFHRPLNGVVYNETIVSPGF